MQILEDIYDEFNDMLIRLLEDKDNPDSQKCLEILNHTLRSWSQQQNSSSILRDGLRKLIDLLVSAPTGKTNTNPSNPIVTNSNPVNPNQSIRNNDQSGGNLNPNQSGNLNQSGNFNGSGSFGNTSNIMGSV